MRPRPTRVETGKANVTYHKRPPQHPWGCGEILPRQCNNTKQSWLVRLLRGRFILAFCSLCLTASPIQWRACISRTLSLLPGSLVRVAQNQPSVPSSRIAEPPLRPQSLTTLMQRTSRLGTTQRLRPTCRHQGPEYRPPSRESHGFSHCPSLPCSPVAFLPIDHPQKEASPPSRPCNPEGYPRGAPCQK